GIRDGHVTGVQTCALPICYQCYSHSIGLQDPPATGTIEETYYCGITSRNWLKRMAEHFAEVRNGSNKTFHRAWRQYQGNANVLQIGRAACRERGERAEGAE